MIRLPINDPDRFIAWDIQKAALLLLRMGMAIEGVFDNVGWRISPLDLDSTNNDTVQISILARGVWQPLGSFVIHEMTMEAIGGFLGQEIQRVITERENHEKEFPF